MSTARIEPFLGTNLATLISMLPGEGMTQRASDVIDFCQRMSGEMYAGWVDDHLVCCWGLIPPTILSNQAYLWMWSSEGIREHAFLLVRHSQREVERMLEHYPTIIGHCRIDRPDSVRWLRWLGAQFGPVEGAFKPFTIQRKDDEPSRYRNQHSG